MSYQFQAIQGVQNLVTGFFRSPSGDWADRLSSRVTVILLGVLSAILMSSHYWGEPINCWVPAEFPDSWAKFVDRFCYVHATYYVPLNEPVPWSSHRRNISINYYQWVPYLLAFQAICFYVPRLVWKSLCRYSGVDLPSLSSRYSRLWHDLHANPEAFTGRLKTVEAVICPQFADALRLYRRKHIQSLLPICYLLSKCLHSINSLVQWWWLNNFLGSPIYPLWGYHILRDLYHGKDWQDTGHFPRVTHCDFTRRRPASFNLETVICVLSLNLYYEKIFLFLWFWLGMIAIANIGNSIYWLVTLSLPGSQKNYVEKFIGAIESTPDGLHSIHITRSPRIRSAYQPFITSTTTGSAGPGDIGGGSTTKEPIMLATSSGGGNPTDALLSEDERRPVEDDPDVHTAYTFVNDALGLDGVFILRMIAVNVGELPAAYLTKALYLRHQAASSARQRKLQQEYNMMMANSGYSSTPPPPPSVAPPPSAAVLIASHPDDVIVSSLRSPLLPLNPPPTPMGHQHPINHPHHPTFNLPSFLPPTSSNIQQRSSSNSVRHASLNLVGLPHKQQQESMTYQRTAAAIGQHQKESSNKRPPPPHSHQKDDSFDYS